MSFALQVVEDLEKAYVMRGWSGSAVSEPIFGAASQFCRRLWSAQTCLRFAVGADLSARRAAPQRVRRPGPPTIHPTRGSKLPAPKARTSPRTPKPSAKHALRSPRMKIFRQRIACEDWSGFTVSEIFSE